MYLKKAQIAVLRQALDTIYYAVDLPKSARAKWRAANNILDTADRERERARKRAGTIKKDKGYKKPPQKKRFCIIIGKDKYYHNTRRDIETTYGIELPSDEIGREKGMLNARVIRKALREKYKRNDIYVKYNRQLEYYKRNEKEYADKRAVKIEKRIADKSNEIILPFLDEV